MHSHRTSIFVPADTFTGNNANQKQHYCAGLLACLPTQQGCHVQCRISGLPVCLLREQLRVPVHESGHQSGPSQHGAIVPDQHGEAPARPDLGGTAHRVCRIGSVGVGIVGHEKEKSNQYGKSRK
jgi:hypothetical protein